MPERWRLNTTGFPETILLGPYDASGAPPVLCAVSEVLNAMAARQAAAVKEGDELAVLLVALPPEDLDVATEPRVYRQLVEAMLAHLEGLQLKRVLVMPPFQYSAPGKYSETVWSDVRAAASAYGAGTVDPAEYMEEKLWRADPKVEGVYGVRPNSAGLKKIEQGLLNLVR
jgi:hypothetical protein